MQFYKHSSKILPSLQRFVKNAFKDREKQSALDLYLLMTEGKKQ